MIINRQLFFVVVCAGAIFSPVVFAAGANHNNGGVGINSTRIIFNEKDKYASVGLRNTTFDTPFLILSSVAEYTEKGGAAPFRVLPNVLRLDGGQTRIVRIVPFLRPGNHFPSDRESVFAYISKAIPASNPSVRINDRVNSNIPVSVSTRIKLFWRPDGIKGDAKSAESSVQFHLNSTGKLEVYNPSAFHVSFSRISINDKTVSFNDSQPEMIAPVSRVVYTLDGINDTTPKTVQWRVINDLGGVDTFSGKLN